MRPGHASPPARTAPAPGWDHRGVSRADTVRFRFNQAILVAAILPDLVKMKGLFQGKPVQPRGDLWDHTMLVLEELPPDPSFPLAFAALLHDVGKPATKGLQDGRVTFHNHELVGRRIADRIGRELKLSNEERERVCWLVEHHQDLGEAKTLREARLKRILAMPGIDELLALHRADALATTGDASQIDYCAWYLREQPAGPINPPPLLTGHDLARHDLSPGPRFKTILDQVRELQLDRVLNSKREALEWLSGLAVKQRVSLSAEEVAQETADNRFLNGRLAMLPQGSWQIKDLNEKAKGFAWDLVPVPVSPLIRIVVAVGAMVSIS